jgi:hypothetical protein
MKKIILMLALAVGVFAQDSTSVSQAEYDLLAKDVRQLKGIIINQYLEYNKVKPDNALFLLIVENINLKAQAEVNDKALDLFIKDLRECETMEAINQVFKKYGLQ